jgi:small conductance mechanosensitive channel
MCEGVPFFEKICALKTADAIAVSFRAMVETAGWSAGAALFLFLISRWTRSSQLSHNHGDLGALQSFALASLRPAMVYVPVQASIKATTILVSMFQVMARRNDGNIVNTIMKKLGCTQEVLPMLRTLNQVVQDVSEVVFILFLVWLLIRIKDIVISKIQLNIQIEKRGESSGIIRLLESVKSLTSVAVWALCTIAAFVACGINAAPVLASLGASSIIVGLAAQPLLSNIVSGIAIFTSRAFVVGDHIELISAGGSKVIEGTVEVVSPLTCVLRDKDDALIYINNGQLTSLLLRNKSQSVVVL